VQAALAPLVNSVEAPRGVWYPTLGISFVGGAVVDVEPILLALQHARDRLVAQGGSLVVECAPDAIASAFDAWGPVGGALEVMRQLKRRFDPGQRLNPGRFVGGI
jgi:glycolate oxidase FAD binding subunit